MNADAVSVVIPARNAEDTLKRAINSVFAQSLRPAEIIVIDDASTDQTAQIAASFTGVIIRTLPKAGGAAAARNAGIRAAKGDWVAFLDADDEWLPAKLEKQLRAIPQDGAPRFVFCASNEFSNDGDPLGDTFRGPPVTTGANTWKALLANNFVATPTVMAPRSLLVKSGGFDETLKVAEDQDMWIRLALEAPPVYLPESLVHVHDQTRSLSQWTLADQRLYTLPMIERHLARLGERLTPKERRAILGARLSRTGRTACARGDLRHGLAMILRAALLGHEPLQNLGVIIRAPVASGLRRMTGRRRNTV